ncbi:MAG TPA: hypothetical protein VFC02_10840 [Anaerolineales bacterium]|jgi:hypothetical protein|nr:hypothetical protein [Anaerolineales bacterium]
MLKVFGIDEDHPVEDVANVDRIGFFQAELRLALKSLDTIPSGHIYIIPIRLNACRIPEPLSPLHYVDMFPSWDNGLKKLLRSIDSQTLIQNKIRTVENEVRSNLNQEKYILLINDEPAAMSSIVDHWKLNGFRVDFAFSIPQAIESISNSLPTVVVSDLSH